ncbi:hypothetical protein PO124_11355 [Bacillus licheniformis]|nr:hypothetical protein [Bacillus licheniformis]
MPTGLNINEVLNMAITYSMDSLKHKLAEIWMSFQGIHQSFTWTTRYTETSGIY